MPIEIRKDPVCGMELAPREAADKSQFGEWVYLFLLCPLQRGLRPRSGEVPAEKIALRLRPTWAVGGGAHQNYLGASRGGRLG